MSENIIDGQNINEKSVLFFTLKPVSGHVKYQTTFIDIYTL